MDVKYFGKPTKNMNGVKVGCGALHCKMANSDATALPLLREKVGHNEYFGGDLIRFPPGGQVRMHTHEGSHLLFCVGGTGTVTVVTDSGGKEEHWLIPGACYLIKSEQPHSIKAKDELTLLAVGNKHFEAWSEARMELTTDY